ncbi:hypothetical protein [Saccharothrix deserti]|uniref:hypothetical protein n=1 Tax=Saccharothrix deserti TaxID=2593674 RepID=UPI00131C347F|nr:hypothetical protein [Saccharothrix deserti]
MAIPEPESGLWQDVRPRTEWPATDELIMQDLGALEDSGWSPLNSATGRITYIRSEGPDIGDQVVTDRAGLLDRAALTGARQFTFQLWNGGDDEILVHLRHVGGGLYSSEVDLHGMAEEERDDVIRVMIGHVRSNLDTTAGFVLDQWGGSLELDWDAIVQGEPAPVAIVPELVALPERVMADHPELLELPHRQLGEHLVATGYLRYLDVP